MEKCNTAFIYKIKEKERLLTYVCNIRGQNVGQNSYNEFILKQKQHFADYNNLRNSERKELRVVRGEDSATGNSMQHTENCM